MTYRLPNGAVPVLLSSDVAELVPAEATAVLSYASDHPDVAPQEIGDMLFRTRVARRYRALAMVTNRDELLGALRAIADDREHPLVVRTDQPASARRLAYVFPGQGSQRPGMGRLFYELVPAFRAEVDRCAEAFRTLLGESPLDYLLDDHIPPHDNARTVQPALFTQMAGLAAMWRALGITPSAAVGHSQGEIAAAYVSGMITRDDAAAVVAIRARAADELGTGDYAMAVVAADRDTCEDLLARCSGWAELSVVNSPSMTGISGDRAAVQGVVDTLTERGTFARVIGVAYPAHTSLINQLGARVRESTRREVRNQDFLDGQIACLGATLGGPITPDLPVDQYWFWNLRNTVRFDKAIGAALAQEIDAFVELAEHPTLQLAIHENLAAAGASDEEFSKVVIGTSTRAATNLDDLTRNLATLAVQMLDYSWAALGTEVDGPLPLPLLDFPNIQLNQTRLWMPYGSPQRADEAVTPAPAAKNPSEDPAADAAPVRLLCEQWVRLSRRSLVPPRRIGIVDHTGACTELATALGTAAADVGASARVIDIESLSSTDDFDTYVILLPPPPQLGTTAAAAEVAAFFADHTWWPGLTETVTECWLVTAGGEAARADDMRPDVVHAAAAAGFRSVGAKYLGVRFRHLDLPAGSTPSSVAAALVAAVHTAGESELALRDGALYAKRIVEADSTLAEFGAELRAATPPAHVLVVGGTGNLGLEFCAHFAQRGSQRITLVSRSGETAALTERLRPLRTATGTQIGVVSCDVSDQEAVRSWAQNYQDAPADLIIHAAVHYSGIELEDITHDLVDQALAPKVVGIANVLEAFPRTDDCRVVLCSSISATVGGRGVIVYAAANRMLDAMAYQLRADGLDCTSVQWGHWNVHDDGDGAALAALAGTGVIAMRPADAIAAGLTTPFRSNVIVASFDAERARSVLETCGRATLLSELSNAVVQPVAPVGGPSPAADPAPETPVSQRLLGLLAGAIGIDSVDKLDPTVPMVAIGLDSLQALELRRRVKLEFDQDLEVAELLSGASIADVLARLGA
ncbi:nocobactin polyketide synthase NbtC [Mycobacterium sp. 1423905.2]|uniref:nocobactin polyketide synthase NbtC n=1 Tax=Mycobacterium sp. 1423905.2 TaxID=1856859 RepID=UPI000AA86EFC|nr:nocobactin polyketide synthase NbtC [Mycobacterium sp. 1423905.2]